MAEYLRAKDVARACGVTQRTILNWCSDRDLPHHRTAGGHVRFVEREVLDWMLRQKIPVPLEGLSERGAA